MFLTRFRADEEKNLSVAFGLSANWMLPGLLFENRATCISAWSRNHPPRLRASLAHCACSVMSSNFPHIPKGGSQVGIRMHLPSYGVGKEGTEWIQFNLGQR